MANVVLKMLHASGYKTLLIQSPIPMVREGSLMVASWVELPSRTPGGGSDRRSGRRADMDELCGGRCSRLWVSLKATGDPYC